MTSEISDGTDHNVDNLPALVLGKAGGAVNPGRHVVLTRQPPVTDVLLAAIQSTGTPATSFAGSTAPLPELK